jgi:hypothetical protein
MTKRNIFPVSPPTTILVHFLKQCSNPHIKWVAHPYTVDVGNNLPIFNNILWIHTKMEFTEITKAESFS